jgi:hypothetical protein
MCKCINCQNDLENTLEMYQSINIPDDRKYIFNEYAKKTRNICIECYIKTIIMFQKNLKRNLN